MRALIVDDEPLAIEFLDHQLGRISTTISIAGKLTQLIVQEQIELLQNVDLVFLDIEMPDQNGLELAEQILEVNDKIEIVFVTAFHDYAVQAFEINALDYLVKPVETDRLQKTLARIEENYQQPAKPIITVPMLQVNVCRELRFNLPDGEPEIVRWRTSKSLELFLYLLHHHDKTIHKSEIIEFMWPEMEEQRALSQLYTTVYHIRRTLRTFGDHLVIESVSESYILLLKDVQIDLEKWEQTLQLLPPIHQNNATLYEQAMELYTGPYLQSYDYLWAESERYRFERQWLKYAYEIADYYLEQHDFNKTEAWFTKISEHIPE